jgi:hypothetical protein
VKIKRGEEKLDIKKYLKYTLPVLILLLLFCWVIIPEFLPQLMEKRGIILLCGALAIGMVGDAVTTNWRK